MLKYLSFQTKIKVKQTSNCSIIGTIAAVSTAFKIRL